MRNRDYFDIVREQLKPKPGEYMVLLMYRYNTVTDVVAGKIEMFTVYNICGGSVVHLKDEDELMMFKILYGNTIRTVEIA